MKKIIESKWSEKISLVGVFLLLIFIGYIGIFIGVHNTYADNISGIVILILATLIFARFIVVEYWNYSVKTETTISQFVEELVNNKTRTVIIYFLLLCLAAALTFSL